MKRLATIVLVLLSTFVTNCGGGGSTKLIVTPATATAFTNFQNGTYQGVTLTATRSDGVMPTGIQWTTTNACIAVGNSISNTATVICNFTCGGMATATITATEQGLTGTSSVTCTWTN